MGTRIRDLLLEYERRGAKLRRAVGLSQNEVLVLLYVAQGESAPTRLSEAVSMTTAGMTNLLDRLEDEGFVRRERHATDGRRILVTLTKRGFHVCVRYEELHERLAELAAGPGDGAAEAVATFLDRATDELRSHTDL